MNGSCQCGAITFTTPTPAPTNLWHCHCTDCRKQSASAFGTSAFFPFFELDERSGAVRYIERTCDSGRRQRCYFCNNCGVRILHHLLPDDGGNPPIVAVKGGVLEGLDWSKAKHIWCRSAVVPIPEGALRCEMGPPEGFAEIKL